MEWFGAESIKLITVLVAETFDTDGFAGTGTRKPGEDRGEEPVVGMESPVRDFRGSESEVDSSGASMVVEGCAVGYKSEMMVETELQGSHETIIADEAGKWILKVWLQIHTLLGGTSHSRRVEEPAEHVNSTEADGPGTEEERVAREAGRQHVLANG